MRPCCEAYEIRHVAFSALLFDQQHGPTLAHLGPPPTAQQDTRALAACGHGPGGCTGGTRTTACCRLTIIRYAA